MAPKTFRNGDGKEEAVVVLFDGVCNLCTGTVRFVMARDPKARFRFASLQSDAARTLMESYGLSRDSMATIVVIDGGRAYTRSDAALRIARYLKSPWPMLVLFRFVPRVLRDAVYNGVARHRYRWFGRREACLVPGPGDAGRFIE